MTLNQLAKNTETVVYLGRAFTLVHFVGANGNQFCRWERAGEYSACYGSRESAIASLPDFVLDNYDDLGMGKTSSDFIADVSDAISELSSDIDARILGDYHGPDGVRAGDATLRDLVNDIAALRYRLSLMSDVLLDELSRRDDA